MTRKKSESQPVDKQLTPRAEVMDGREVRYRRRRVDLRSLSGTARESARRYREWSTGRIDWQTYMTAVKGLAEHRGTLQAVETHERQTLVRQQLLEELRRQGALSPSPALAELLLPQPPATEAQS